MTTIYIQGMTCGGCADSVQKALMQIPGVSQVSVRLSEQSADVVHTDEVSNQALVDAVEGAGFDVVKLGAP